MGKNEPWPFEDITREEAERLKQIRDDGHRTPAGVKPYSYKVLREMHRMDTGKDCSERVIEDAIRAVELARPDFAAMRRAFQEAKATDPIAAVSKDEAEAHRLTREFLFGKRPRRRGDTH